MDLILLRKEKGSNGVFGELLDASTKDVLMRTLEHAYLKDNHFEPVLPVGDYPCVRGLHRLGHQKDPFFTFEVKDVPGHFGILFHVGNFNHDSEGCILVGMNMLSGMLCDSGNAFIKFMELQDGVTEFYLQVMDASI